jgi:uncharacterized protein (TIGR02271 family)
VTRSHSHLNLGEQSQLLSELPDYKIEPGDPDPRGWPVVSADDRPLGRVEDLVIDTSAMKVRYLVVTPDNASADSPGSTLVDTADVDIRDRARQVVARTLPGAQASRSAERNTAATPPSSETTATRTLTRAEEELTIGTREVSRGAARISKHVETEHVSQPVTRRREEVVVERRPVEAGARGDASIGADEIHVPLMEDEVVIEKRPVVKEELVIGKRVVEEHDVVEADVRREEFDIDETSKPGASTRGSRGEGY